MKLRILSGVAVLALCVSPAFAKGDPHGGKSHEAKQSHGHEHVRDSHHEHDQHAKARPAGWDKGKKTGWGNCDVPPGQAKKSGCNPHASHHDRDRHGHPHDGDHRATDRHVSTHHQRTAQSKAAPRPHPTNRTTTATRTTTTTTTATKGEHPFSPTLRKKKEVEDPQRVVYGSEKTK